MQPVWSNMSYNVLKKCTEPDIADELTALVTSS